ncbi:MAG: GNAT family N-acetyltransferase [Neomegalonema sp.]|nr:GNAT family N-acetyltransferase [Neomegalonema sp.]
MAADVKYTVTFLEMTTAPRGAVIAAPEGGPFALIRAQDPPVHYFLYLYRTVGEPYQWTDMLRAPEAELAAFVQDPKVELYSLLRAGAPAGFYQLDFRQADICSLAYFGLTPEAVGQGVGRWLLDTAIREGWRRGVRKMIVNTCTLDHPSALAMYQRAGFAPVRREERVRIDS